MGWISPFKDKRWSDPVIKFLYVYLIKKQKSHLHNATCPRTYNAMLLIGNLYVNPKENG